MSENLNKRQVYIITVGILLTVIVAGVFWYLSSQKEATEEKIPEPRKDLIEQTTAPGGSLLSPEEEERLIEETTAPQ